MFVILNLIKFRERAADGSGSAVAAYNRYSDVAVAMIAERGGRVAWIGRVDEVLTGDAPAGDWDIALLVEYPTRAAFDEMISRADYKEAHAHREAAVERQIAIACTPLN